jgi:hypothetical protein
MQHALFGEIERWRECWVGSYPLPRLAALAQSRFGEISHQPPGSIAIHIKDPEKVGPSAQQEAAFRDLQENEAAIAEAIVATLWRSYQAYLGMGAPPEPNLKAQNDITKAAEVRNVEIAAEHQRGLAYVVFEIDCAWEPEHGIYVVYHRDTPAEWTTAGELMDLLPSDDQAEQVEQPAPPLCAAVDRMNVELVQRLLASGADPNVRGRDNQTPLRHARNYLAIVKKWPGFGRGWLSRLFSPLIDFLFYGGLYKDTTTRLNKIIQLLEAAGGK